MYFERLVQRARILAEHSQLWKEVGDVVGHELASRIQYVNSKNIDSVIKEVEKILG